MSSHIPFIRVQERPISKLETVDRNNLIRTGRTVQVSSLNELQAYLHMPQDLSFPGGAETGYISASVLDYLRYATNIKPEADFKADSTAFSFFTAPLRLAVSTFATKEVLDSNMEEQIRQHLESIIDSYEAIIAHVVVFSLSFNGGNFIVLDNYRDVFSRLVGFASDLEAGTENIYISIPTSFLYASLYEVDVERTTQSASNRPEASTQWWQNERWLDVNVRFVKVPMHTSTPFIARNGIVAYTDFVAKNFTRYVLNGFHIERVKEAASERNLYRITYDRYFAHDVPVLRTNASSRNILGIPIITAAVAIYSSAADGTIANSHPIGSPPGNIISLINDIA